VRWTQKSTCATARAGSQFDPQYIGVIYDPGNMVHEGYECWRLGMELLGPYLHEVHAKNAIWEAADGTVLRQPHFSGMHSGFANWQQIMEDLKAVGYDGWIAFEDFSEDEGDIEKVRAQFGVSQEL
jgi:sugar phosphate isomerase/epimerase